jgi:hypothetical protein
VPVNAYFSGHGREVLRDMERRYGKKKGKQRFYATANARNQTPGHVSSQHRADALKRRVKHG